MRFRLLAIAAVVAGILTGCVNAPKDLPPLPPASAQSYTIDTSDKLRVTVFGQQSLSGEYTINDSGMIAMPLIGQVKVAGLTPGDAEKTIAQQLARGYLVNPSVSVEVQGARPFFIIGEVEKPGQYQYVNGMTVVTAVSMGGGFTPRANQNYFSITRKVGDRTIEGRASRDTPVFPGDTINVFERYF